MKGFAKNDFIWDTSVKLAGKITGEDLSDYTTAGYRARKGETGHTGTFGTPDISKVAETTKSRAAGKTDITNNSNKKFDQTNNVNMTFNMTEREMANNAKSIGLQVTEEIMNHTRGLQFAGGW